jgi:PKD repeat protein
VSAAGPENRHIWWGTANIGTLDGQARTLIRTNEKHGFMACRRSGRAVNNPARAAPTCCDHGGTTHDRYPSCDGHFIHSSSAQPGGVYTVTVVIAGDGQQVSTTTSATVGGLNYGFVPSPILPIEIAPTEAIAGTPTPGLGIGPFWASPTPDPAAYSAMVDWGDGSTPTAATITGSDSGELTALTSGHTYAAAGNYTITTTIRDSQGYVVGTGNDPIYVFNPIAVPSSSLTATAGSPTGPLTVATVTAQPYIQPVLAAQGVLAAVAGTSTGQPNS